MESHSEKNRILCSEASADLLRAHGEKVSINRRGIIRPKGLGEMMAYWVAENNAPPPPPESAICTGTVKKAKQEIGTGGQSVDLMQYISKEECMYFY